MVILYRNRNCIFSYGDKFCQLNTELRTLSLSHLVLKLPYFFSIIVKCPKCNSSFFSIIKSESSVTSRLRFGRLLILFWKTPLKGEVLCPVCHHDLFESSPDE